MRPYRNVGFPDYNLTQGSDTGLLTLRSDATKLGLRSTSPNATITNRELLACLLYRENFAPNVAMATLKYRAKIE